MGVCEQWCRAGGQCMWCELPPDTRSPSRSASRTPPPPPKPRNAVTQKIAYEIPRIMQSHHHSRSHSRVDFNDKLVASIESLLQDPTGSTPLTLKHRIETLRANIVYLDHRLRRLEDQLIVEAVSAKDYVGIRKRLVRERESMSDKLILLTSAMERRQEKDLVLQGYF